MSEETSVTVGEAEAKDSKFTVSKDCALFYCVLIGWFVSRGVITVF